MDREQILSTLEQGGAVQIVLGDEPWTTGHAFLDELEATTGHRLKRQELVLPQGYCIVAWIKGKPAPDFRHIFLQSLQEAEDRGE